MQNRIEVLGHRGATDPASAVQENSLAAFELARRQGASGVELDVRIGRDGSLLVNHDPVLADGRAVADIGIDDRPPSMPILREALDVLAGCLVNIEIKNIPGEAAFDPACAVVDAVIGLLESRAWADRVIVSSFHPSTVDRVKQLRDDVATGLLNWFVPSVSDAIDLARAGGHDAIHPHVAFIDAELVARAHDAGLAVTVWTVNEPADLIRMVEIGVDGIVTDDVPAALDVLRRG